MGKQSNVVKARVCLNCKSALLLTSKGMRKHFAACCRKSRGLDKPRLEAEVVE